MVVGCIDNNRDCSNCLPRLQPVWDNCEKINCHLHWWQSNFRDWSYLSGRHDLSNLDIQHDRQEDDWLYRYSGCAWEQWNRYSKPDAKGVNLNIRIWFNVTRTHRFRLKYMQVISIISRDGFLSKYNVSVPTDDFIEILKSFPSLWSPDKNDKPYIYGVQGNWSDRYVAK